MGSSISFFEEKINEKRNKLRIKNACNLIDFKNNRTVRQRQLAISLQGIYETCNFTFLEAEKLYDIYGFWDKSRIINEPENFNKLFINNILKNPLFVRDHYVFLNLIAQKSHSIEGLNHLKSALNILSYFNKKIEDGIIDIDIFPK